MGPVFQNNSAIERGKQYNVGENHRHVSSTRGTRDDYEPEPCTKDKDQALEMVDPHTQSGPARLYLVGVGMNLTVTKITVACDNQSN